MTILRPRLFLAVSGAVAWSRLPLNGAGRPPSLRRSTEPIGSSPPRRCALSTRLSGSKALAPSPPPPRPPPSARFAGLDAPFVSRRRAGSAPVRLSAPALFPSASASPRARQGSPRATPASAAHFAYADVPARRLPESALAAISSSLPAAVPAPNSAFRRRPRSVPRPRSSTTRATLRAWRRSPRRRATRPGERRWNGRRCAPARSVLRGACGLPRSPPTWPSRGSLRDRQEGELAAHPEARPRSPSFSPAARRKRARERSPRRARQERWGATTKRREQSAPCGATAISTP